jgi:hypothetical protein
MTVLLGFPSHVFGLLCLGMERLALPVRSETHICEVAEVWADVTAATLNGVFHSIPQSTQVNVKIIPQC